MSGVLIESLAQFKEMFGGECHLCRREAPCECMTSVEDGGPWHFDLATGLFVYTGDGGWSLRPERCMCSCGRCQAP